MILLQEAVEEAEVVEEEVAVVAEVCREVYGSITW